jgi:hypothetical protein
MTKLEIAFRVSPRLCPGLPIVLWSDCHPNQFCSKFCGRIWVTKSKTASGISPVVQGYVWGY